MHLMLVNWHFYVDWNIKSYFSSFWLTSKVFLRFSVFQLGTNANTSQFKSFQLQKLNGNCSKNKFHKLRYLFGLIFYSIRFRSVTGSIKASPRGLPEDCHKFDFYLQRLPLRYPRTINNKHFINIPFLIHFKHSPHLNTSSLNLHFCSLLKNSNVHSFSTSDSLNFACTKKVFFNNKQTLKGSLVVPSI